MSRSQSLDRWDPSAEDHAYFAEQADQLWLQSPLLSPLVGSWHLLVARDQLCNVHIINLTFMFPDDAILVTLCDNYVLILLCWNVYYLCVSVL